MSVLVAGIGNVFLGDDGFGSEVARRLLEGPVPEGVRIQDYGIRSVHLAYEMLDGWDLVVLVDALQRGELPGTLTLLEARIPEVSSDAAGFADAHAMTPETVLSIVATLGERPPRVLVVGCEPHDCDEGMGLSPPVADSVPRAVAMVEEVLREHSLAHEGPHTNERPAQVTAG